MRRRPWRGCAAVAVGPAGSNGAGRLRRCARGVRENNPSKINSAEFSSQRTRSIQSLAEGNAVAMENFVGGNHGDRAQLIVQRPDARRGQVKIDGHRLLLCHWRISRHPAPDTRPIFRWPRQLRDPGVAAEAVPRAETASGLPERRPRHSTNSAGEAPAPRRPRPAECGTASRRAAWTAAPAPWENCEKRRTANRRPSRETGSAKTQLQQAAFRREGREAWSSCSWPGTGGPFLFGAPRRVQY